MSERTALLTVKHLSKTFPGQKAVNDVSLKIYEGEVLALVGQNGSGKSTLIKVLSGYHTPDPGSNISLGRSSSEERPTQAKSSKLRFIHQDLGLVGSLNAIDNIAMGNGYENGRGRRISWRRSAAITRQALSRLGVDIDIDIPVSMLTAVDRTMIAIARAMVGLGEGTGVLVLDEPTVSLPGPEVEKLFSAIEELRTSGLGILYVSHVLEEVFRIADRVMVLRDGKHVSTSDTSSLSRDDLVRQMIGGELRESSANRLTAASTGDICLQLKDVTTRECGPLSLHSYAGEVLGITGLVGSGLENIPELIYGLTSIQSGDMLIDGKAVERATPYGMKKIGVGLVPANRAEKGCILTQDVEANLLLPDLRSVGTRWRLSRRRQLTETRLWIRRVDIRPPEPQRILATMSGGNQQKVVIAKWLRLSPRLLVLHEPTQGVDVGARAAIWDLLLEQAAEGMSIVVCSAEIDELVKICDRILIVDKNGVKDELLDKQLNVHAVTQATLAPRLTAGDTNS